MLRRGAARRVLHAQGRGREAEFFARMGRETASELDIWSQVLSRLTQALVLADRGKTVEAEEVAREALGIVELTDLLELHGDALLDLGEVLRSPVARRVAGERRGGARLLSPQGQRGRGRSRPRPARAPATRA